MSIHYWIWRSYPSFYNMCYGLNFFPMTKHVSKQFYTPWGQVRCVWLISLFLITWVSWLNSLQGFFPFPSSPGAVAGAGGSCCLSWNASLGLSHLLKDRKKSNYFLYTKAFHVERGMGGGLVIRRGFMTSFKTQAPSQNVFITIFIYPSLLSTQQCLFTMWNRNKCLKIRINEWQLGTCLLWVFGEFFALNLCIEWRVNNSSRSQWWCKLI